MELLALVKHDCPVCDEVLPVLDRARASGAPVRIVSQSSETETAEQATRLHLSTTPELDPDLELSALLDPDAVPAIVLLDGGEERDRVEGLDRKRLGELAGRAGVDARARRPPRAAARLRQHHARPEGGGAARGAEGARRGAAAMRASSRSASSRT